MEVFDFKRFFKTLSHTKFLAIVIMLLSILTGYYYSYNLNTPMYESTAILVLVQDNDKKYQNSGESYITGADVALNKNLISTYSSIATSDKVLDKVIKNLNLNMSTKVLADSIKLKSANNTEVINISVANESNRLAKLITNELVDVFCDEIEELYNMSNIYVMDYAELSTEPYNINHIKDFIVFFVLGIAFYFIMVFFIYIFDTTIKSEKDLENYTHLNVISSIPLYNKPQHSNELIVFTDPKSPITEAFKACRTNIMFANSTKKSSVILITSASPHDGKSFVSSNLALAYAQSGKKVLLIDTDMRNGRVHEVFDLRKKLGLSGCLAKISSGKSDVNINKYIKETNYKNLHIMTAGINPSNPSELLSSEVTHLLLDTLKTKYDVVICDGTPCTLVSDSIILSKIVDYTILVTSCKNTKLDVIKKVKRSIEIAGGKINGAILNKELVNKKKYKNKYYHNALPQSTIITKEIVLEHDETLDIPLYLVSKLSPIYENIDIENLDDDIADNSIPHSTKVIAEVNKLIDAKFNDMEISTNRIVENFTIKMNHLDKNHESSMSAIDELKKQLETLSYSSMSLHEKLNMQQEDLYSKLDEQLESCLKGDEELDTKINNIVNSVIKNDTSLDEKLEVTIQTQDEQLNQLNELQDSIYDIQDDYAETTNNLKEKLDVAIQTQDEQLNQINELQDSIYNIQDDYTEATNNLKEKLDVAIQAQDEQLNQINELQDSIHNIQGDYDETKNNLKEKLDIAIYSSEEQIKQIKQLQDSISLIKDVYENKFYEQQKHLLSLEEKISELINNSNKSSKVEHIHYHNNSSRKIVKFKKEPTNIIATNNTQTLNTENTLLLENSDELTSTDSVVNNIEPIQEPEVVETKNIHKDSVNELENIISTDVATVSDDIIENTMEEKIDNIPIDTIKNNIIENVDIVENNEDIVPEDINIIENNKNTISEDVNIIEDNENTISENVNIIENTISKDINIIEDIIDEKIENITITNETTAVKENTDSILEDANNDSNFENVLNSNIQNTIEKNISNETIDEVEKVSKEHINNLKHEAYTYANNTEVDERKVVKKGFLSFIKRNNKLPQEELIDEEECEPVSQILSIG